MNKKLYHLAVAIYPILSGYGLSPQADFGTITILVLGILYLVNSKKKIKAVLPKGYACFFWTAIVFALLYAHTIPFRLLLFTINLCIACLLVDFRMLKNYYGVSVCVCCSFFMLQYLSALFIGVHISGIFTFLPSIYEGRGVDIAYELSLLDRFSSFFLEPSYFVQYIFPYLSLCLFSDKEKKYVIAILISVIMLLSRSGTGIFLLLINWGLWLFFSNSGIRIKIGLILLGCSFMILLMTFAQDFIDSILKRATELQSYEGDEQFQSSGFIRFFRGYYVYADMPLVNKILGANPADVRHVVQANVFFTNDDEGSGNGIQTLLLYHGLIVCLLYLRHILYFLRGGIMSSVAIAICCVYLLFGESFYLCSRMFLCTTIMFCILNSNIINKQ